MRRLLALAGVIAAVAVFGAAAAQAEVIQNDTQTLPFAVFVPCANGGAGEVVTGTIELHSLITFTINGNNVSGKTHFQPQGSDLVGATTGDKYEGTGVTQESFKMSLQNGQATQTFINNFRIIGPGPGNNFLFHENAHVTINANGDVTVTHDNLSVECK